MKKVFVSEASFNNYYFQHDMLSVHAYDVSTKHPYTLKCMGMTAANALAFYQGQLDLAGKAFAAGDHELRDAHLYNANSTLRTLSDVGWVRFVK